MSYTELWNTRIESLALILSIQVVSSSCPPYTNVSVTESGIHACTLPYGGNQSGSACESMPDVCALQPFIHPILLQIRVKRPDK